MSDARRVAGAVALVSGTLLALLTLAGPFVGSSAAAMPMHGGMLGTMAGHMGHHGVTGTVAPAIAGAPETVIEARDLVFTPAEARAAPGDLNVTLRNTGKVLHDLTIPQLGLHLVAQPGESATAGLRSVPPGTYAGYCSVAGHADAGMRLTLVVR
ncbi:MAG TPA: cupredoxin domain-containing protein [Candidatus Limnocylindria bacterium]|nr:cupredoxin domain-containing protein [Candidatus Limnocylindria bacterium]